MLIHIYLKFQGQKNSFTLVKMIHLGIVFVIFFSSCKNKLEKSNKYYENKISVTVNYKIDHDDIFQVFYTTKETENYSEEKRITKKVKKESIFRQVLFDFPNNVLPKKIRIDLGEKQVLGRISINEIIIKNGIKQFVIDSTMIKYFFNPNIYLDYDIRKNIFTTKIITGRSDPYLLSTPLLDKKLEIYF